MPYKHRGACRVCGSSSGHLSRRNLCIPCAVERMTQASIELQAREGPIYNSWRESLLEGVERLPGS